MVLYHIAENEKKEIVDIQDVSEQNRNEKYLCVACGNEMRPVLGNEREHHFRHIEKGECNGETYLHWYAKYHIKKVFDDSKGFYISYKVPERCCEYDNCECRKDEKFYKYKYPDCERNILSEREDLKLKGYDTCEIESGYKEFIADVKLYSKKNLELEPIFIEITVTHKCNSKKLESGIKIIEIVIPKNEKISFNNSEIVETSNEEKKINIKFHNFEREEKLSEKIFNNSISFNGKIYGCTEYSIAKEDKFDLERRKSEEHLLNKKEKLEQKQNNLVGNSMDEDTTNKDYTNNWFGQNKGFPINENFDNKSNNLVKSPTYKNYTNALDRDFGVNENFYN